MYLIMLWFYWILKKLDEIQLKNDFGDRNLRSNKFIIFFKGYVLKFFFYQLQDLRHVLWDLTDLS